MKSFSWRSGVAAAIFVSTTGMASAQVWTPPTIPTPANNATQVTWSIGASEPILEYAAIAKVQVTPIGAATVPVLPAVVDDEPVGVTVYFPALSTAHDAVTGLATAVASAGGVQVTVPRTTAVAAGGVLTLSNWGIDAVTRQLSADITGTRGVPNQTQVAVFTLGSPVVTGATTSFSLWLTQAGADAFSQAMGLQSLGLNSLQNARQYSFGTVSVNVAMVPEPSSVALMLAGLSAVAVVARRRHRAMASAQPA